MCAALFAPRQRQPSSIRSANLCDFQPTADGRWECSRCGRNKQRKSVRRCDVQPFGLGNLVAWCLAVVGITPRRWLRVKRFLLWLTWYGPLVVRLGCPVGCGCKKRQAALNRLTSGLLAGPPAGKSEKRNR